MGFVVVAVLDVGIVGGHKVRAGGLGNRRRVSFALGWRRRSGRLLGLVIGVRRCCQDHPL